MDAAFRMYLNPRFAGADAFPDAVRALIDEASLGSAWQDARGWPEYDPTPLRRLGAVAARLGVADVRLKDESGRFGLGSFKSIGAAYGVLCALRAALAEVGIDADSGSLRSGELAERTRGIVLTCATDGNHGRAVAWAARMFGCGCVVFVPRIVSPARRAAIEAEGATVVGVDGTYDDALRVASEEAERHDRVVVSDQAYPGYEAIPRDIMRGYAIVAAEALEAMDAPPSHVFVQAGVGGFAAAVCAYLWARLGAARPRFVCVEPGTADCLYRSAVAGRLVKVDGDLDTLMGCLSCGEGSSLGWTILESGATAFVAIADDWAVAAMKTLAAADVGLAIGESGAAGLAGLMAVASDAGARRSLGIEDDARVLLFGTEGANDPQRYVELVGRSAAEVATRARSTSG